MIVNINVDGQTIKWASGRKPKVAAGSIQFVHLHFEFSSDWDDCVITAQFTQEEKTYNKLLENNECVLPNEIVEGACAISCFGYHADGEIRATAAPLYFGVFESGFIGDGEDVIPPTPDLYAQLLGKIDGALKNSVPIIRNGTWWVWSSIENDYVDTGVNAEGTESEPVTDVELLSAMHETGLIDPVVDETGSFIVNNDGTLFTI